MFLAGAANGLFKTVVGILVELTPGKHCQPTVSVSRLRETKGKCGNLTRWERATSNLHQSCHRARFSDSGPNLKLRMAAKVIHALFLADRTSKCVFLVFFLYNPY